MKHQSKIVFIRSSAIGDVVLASACLNYLKRLDYQDSIYWIGKKLTNDLLNQAYPDVTYFNLEDNLGEDERFQSLFSKVKPSHDALLIDLQCNLRSRRLANRFKRAGYKIYRPSKEQFFRNKLIAAARIRGRGKPQPTSEQQIKFYQYKNMLNTLFIGLNRSKLNFSNLNIVDGIRPELNFTQQNSAPYQSDLSIGTWIGLAPGASYKTKEAPPELFCEILQAIRSRVANDVGICFFGSQDERELCHALQSKLNWSGPTLNLAGKTNLQDSAQAIGKLKVLLSNDSSLVHIAEAQGVPVLALFGPTSEAFGFAPHLDTSKAFSSPVGCRPCSKHGKTPCRYDDKICFNSLSVAEIAQSLSDICLSESH